MRLNDAMVQVSALELRQNATEFEQKLQKSELEQMRVELNQHKTALQEMRDGQQTVPVGGSHESPVLPAVSPSGPPHSDGNNEKWFPKSLIIFGMDAADDEEAEQQLREFREKLPEHFRERLGLGIPRAWKTQRGLCMGEWPLLEPNRCSAANALAAFTVKAVETKLRIPSGARKEPRFVLEGAPEVRHARDVARRAADQLRDTPGIDGARIEAIGKTVRFTTSSGSKEALGSCSDKTGEWSWWVSAVKRHLPISAEGILRLTPA